LLSRTTMSSATLTVVEGGGAFGTRFESERRGARFRLESPGGGSTRMGAA